MHAQPELLAYQSGSSSKCEPHLTADGGISSSGIRAVLLHSSEAANDSYPDSGGYSSSMTAALAAADTFQTAFDDSTAAAWPPDCIWHMTANNSIAAFSHMCFPGSLELSDYAGHRTLDRKIGLVSIQGPELWLCPHSPCQ